MLTCIFLTVDMQLGLDGLVPTQLKSVVTTNLRFSTFRTGGFHKMLGDKKMISNVII